MLKSITSTTTINTIVIFVRFDGANEFYNNRNYFDPLFNSTSQESLKDYVQEVSYNQMDISSTFYPICEPTTNLSVEDDYARDYYIDIEHEPNGYSNFTERRDREHGLVTRTVEAIASEVPTGLNLDANNDGNVDHVCIIVQGGSLYVESGDLLWPHQWSLYSEYAYINGKRVLEYTFLNTAISLVEETICHEFLHVLGMPDTYHSSTYKPDIEPTGYWEIMGDRNGNFPHPGAYLKSEYCGWINSIPEITSEGIYSINPLTSSSNNCYKILSPFSCNEYFVVEYRKRSGDYEGTLEGDGLLVYRINTYGDNYYGPNDEVYIYRPNGTLIVNGSPQNAHYSSQMERTSIDDSTNPSSFLCDGSLGGLKISDIGLSGTTISFKVDFLGDISGPSLICSSGATFTVNNLPPVDSIIWETGPYLNVDSGQYTNSPVIKATGNSSSWVTSRLVTDCGSITLPQQEVWAGAPKIAIVDGPTTTPNNQWAYYTAQLESTLSSPTDYNWILNPLNGNSVYDYGQYCDIAFYNSGSYQLVVQAKNTCSDPNYGPYYVTGIYVYDTRSLSISPNPATGETTLTIESGAETEALKSASISEGSFDDNAEWDMEIYSPMQALQTKKTRLKGKSTTIQTAGWTEGVYTVRVKYKDEILTGKLIVKR